MKMRSFFRRIRITAGSAERQRSRLDRVTLALLCALPLVASDAAAQDAPASQTMRQGWSDERLYLEACAACHGTDGRGQTQERVGFAVPLPDFRDCRFARREPDADWWTVAHQGGPVRAFSELMPAFGAALTSEEIDGTLRHIRTLCTDSRWPRGELNLPRPMITEKAFPEDEVVLTTRALVEGTEALLQEIVYEQRFGPRSQFEVVVPFGTIEQSPDDWSGGIADVSVGVKHALYHRWNGRSGSIVSITGEVILPSGDEEKGLGGGTTSFEPFVTWGQLFASGFFLQLQAGGELPFEGRASEEGFGRLALGRSFNPDPYGRTWTPMLEILGSRELTGGEELLWDLAPQFQVTLSTRQHVMLNVAVRFPLNETQREETEILVYVLWDWFDGGFFQGW